MTTRTIPPTAQQPALPAPPRWLTFTSQQQRNSFMRWLRGYVAAAASQWTHVDEGLPKCDLKPDSFGVEVLIHPPHNGESTAYFGCRVTREPSFYKGGAVLRDVEFWMDVPAPPLGR